MNYPSAILQIELLFNLHQELRRLEAVLTVLYLSRAENYDLGGLVDCLLYSAGF